MEQAVHIPVIPSIPTIPVQKPRQHQPSRDDLVKQAKATGSRYKRYPCIVTIREGVTGAILPGGYVLSAGRHEVLVDESEIEQLQALEETQTEALALAKSDFENDMMSELDRTRPGWRSESRSVEEHRAAYLAGLKVTGNSVEKCFTRRMRRGVLPIEKLEIGQPIAPIELDTDANPTIVAAIATAAANAVVAGQQADKQPAKRG